MLKSLFDTVMERRSRELLDQVEHWLPSDGTILDLGSGTGHLSAHIEQELALDVVTADVSDMHVVGRAPVLIDGTTLPFENGEFSTALLFFMLAYPDDPAAVLAEAARVASGRVILVQSLYSGRAGYAWHRYREFIWTIVAFHASKLIGYVPSHAKFSMRTRRFYTRDEVEREIARAGLRIRSRNERAVLPAGALVVAALMLERND